MIGTAEVHSDEHLSRLVLLGDRDAFGRLYERYRLRAYRLAYGMTGHRESAEDLTQEIFLRAYEKLGQYAGQASFSTWFYRLAKNRCLDHYRQQQRKSMRETSDDSELAVVPVNAEDAEAQFHRLQVATRVRRALRGLKPRLRQVIILKDIQGLSYDEIADRLDCSRGTVASRLNRGRILLARRLRTLNG